MEKSLLIAGFGGQGVQTLGKMIAYAANEDDKNVTFAPSYGGEMRGGTSNCTVVVSDRQICSPNKQFLDVVTVLNEASLKQFENRVKPGGTLIVNESLVTSEVERGDIKVVKVPLNEITSRIGSEKVLNVITMGFIVEYTGIVSGESARAIVEEKLGKKEQFRKMNNDAYLAGVSIAKELS
ncbi:MAG: 2-oxoacid:acceptor oxidoreductase family protein [Mogibacterium sp.]|nr:2-oxoacid:acceptor oxidoreductase family protein [Mogibacterium sp.]